jgi:hypothetical protein
MVTNVPAVIPFTGNAILLREGPTGGLHIHTGVKIHGLLSGHVLQQVFWQDHISAITMFSATRRVRFTGTDCSGFLCFVWNIARTNTTNLYNNKNFTSIPITSVQAGDALVKASSAYGYHAILVV